MQKRNEISLVQMIGGIIIKKLSDNPKDNILIIIKGVQKVFNSKLCIYNCFNEDYTELTTYTNLLKKYEADPSDAIGHICTDVALMDIGKPIYIKDLVTTNYLYTDLVVKELSLRTYLGVPVKGRNKVFGVLSVVYDEVREFDDIENTIMHNITDNTFIRPAKV